ncbi:MAG: 16S rRNA (adenine(1518)-N(6)/adenine(1519)-N(6))-dimethyltransferase RsmA [Candidatus Eisenbacteria bacterium]
MTRERNTPAEEARALRRAGHRPRKRLGQNFLVDPNLLRKIADSAGLGPSDRVVEIGSGPGTLTELLADRAGTVHSVEIDGELLARQKKRLRGRTNVVFVHGDFLGFDLEAAAAGEKLVVAGNIPYRVTARIIEKLMVHASCVDRAILCLQKEVADRIASAPGSRAFGRISLLVRYHCRAEVLFRIGPACFRPRPRVESAAIRLRFHDPLPVRAASAEALFRLARALFGGRRKMIRSGLRAIRSFSAEELRRIEEASRVDLSARPEDLEVAEWCRLSDALEALR